MQSAHFPGGKWISSLATKWTPLLRQIGIALLWIAGFALAVFPPALVMLQRWWNLPGLRDIVRASWCRSAFLCQTWLPSYFLWIIPAWLALLGLILWATHPQPLGLPQELADQSGQPDGVLPPAQRRLAGIAGGLAALIALVSLILAIVSGRIPGAEIALAAGYLLARQWLLGRPHAELYRRFVAGLAKALPLAFGWLMLILFLRDLASPGRPAWLSGLCLALTACALARRSRVSPVYWIASFALALLAWRINDWRFAVVGDEFSFFFSARELAVDQTIWANLERMFDGLLVYHSHPYLSSLIQAISLRLLGVDNFGWRFSNPFLIAVSLFFYYRFFLRFLSRRVSWMTILLLGCSHYLLVFSKIGYNNPQAFFLLGLLLWAGGEAACARSRLAYATLGAVMGLALYLYPAALYTLPLPVLLILFYDPPTSRTALRRYLPAVALFALFYLPILFQPEYWLEKLPGTFLNPNNDGGIGNLLLHLATNLIYALFSYLYAVEETHFVSASFVDPFTAALLPLGLGWLAGRLPRERFARFWLLSFVFMLFAVGTTHDRSAPPNTRMFLLLPWFCSLGALGLDWLAGQIRRPRKTVAVFTALALAGILLANLYMAYPLTRQRYAGVGGTETFFLRLLQRDQQLSGDSIKTYLFITQEDWDIDGFRTLRDLYGLPQSPAQLVRVAVDEPLLPLDMLLLAKAENTIVILQPDMNSPLRESLEARLDGLGKQRCPVRDTLDSEVVFTYWYAEAWQALCPRNADWSLP